MHPVKAVLFDLDGTLVSTRPEYRYHVVGSTLAQLGRPVVRAHVDTFWFEGDRDALIRSVFDVEPLHFWRVYAEFDLPDVRTAHTVVFDDVPVLQVLRGRGIRLGIVTNAPSVIAKSEIALVGEHLFDDIIVTGPSFRLKPKPEPDGILACLENLGIAAEHALYVGNSTEDIQAAKAANVRDVHIDRQEYQLVGDRAKPSTIIQQLEELLILASL